MSNIRKIIERVQKLLAASKSENEHEAALAASRAAKLMEEYNLSEALIRVHDHTAKAEPIIDGVRLVDATKKRSAWRESIADAVAKSLGCKTYLMESKTVCFGREGATQAWNYTCQYLFREVDRLADEAWDREGGEALEAGQSIKRWKNAFRVGAAYAVAARLYEQTAASKLVREERIRAVAEDRVGAATSNYEQALMVVDRDETEFQSAYAARSAKFGTAKSVGQVSSRTGYHAGKEAGQNVTLGGGRAGLPSGQGRLK